MADFEFYSGDSKTLRIPVLNTEGQPVDLSGADIAWRLSGWLGGEAIVQKSRVAAGPSNEIGLETPAGGSFPSTMLVHIQAGDVVVPGGLYSHQARVIFADAEDTVRSGPVLILDAPGSI